MDKIDQSDKKRLRRFVGEYLRPDGVLVLRLMALNTNEIVVAEVIAELWEYYKSNPPIWNRKADDGEDV